MNWHAIRQVLLALPRFFLALAVLVHDALIVVLARPLRWLWQLQLLRRMQAWVARQSALTVLVLLVVPLIVLEPAKLIGVFWLATGRFVAGLAMLVFAYGVSLVLIERIFDAGLPALLQWAWFRRLYGWFTGFRAAIMARIRAWPLVQAAKRWTSSARALWLETRQVLTRWFLALRQRFGSG